MGKTKLKSSQRDIDERVRDAVSKYIDPEQESPEWFLDMPKNTRGNIIGKFLASVKESSAEAELEVLSLTEALNELPDIPDLTEDVAKLKAQVEYLKNMLWVRKQKDGESTDVLSEAFDKGVDVGFTLRAIDVNKKEFLAEVSKRCRKKKKQ